MIEYVITPIALIGFLLTWGLAESETLSREANRPVPTPDPVPEIVPPVRKGWLF